MQVIIPFYSNEMGLVSVLTQLQLQTILPETIAIIDTSAEGKAREIVERYSFKNCEMRYIHEQCHIYKAWNIGIEVTDGSRLFLNDDVIVPNNLIQELTWALVANTYAVVPETPPRYFSSKIVEGRFEKYCRDVQLTETKWLSGFAFLLTEQCIKDVGMFDEKFQVWYGDTDYETRILKKDKIVLLKNLFVYHYGNTSYNYHKLLEVIEKDRQYYVQKHSLVRS